MKKILTLLSLALLATTAQAETETAKTEFGAELAPIANASSEKAELVMANYELNDSNLWEILDIDKDGFISKEEALSSKQLSDRWDNLDSNKDEKLDTVEFSQIFSQKN